MRTGGAVRLDERARDDAAELAKQRAPVGKERPDELGNGKDVLLVRHGPQHELLDPVAPGEYALLVATRAEVARLAGEREQQVMTAAAAADAREALVRVAAIEEALEHAPFDGAPHPA
jgi:hypothetical protein